MASIKRNFLYSSVLTTSNFVFAFATYPYVTRILGVANIGICNWVDSIINYFLLFSMMGIVVIGNREIAANKEDAGLLNTTFSSLLSLNAIFTFGAGVVLFVLILTVPQFYKYKELMFVGLVKLLTNFLTIDWLYKGLEKFKYVTTCSLIVKILYVVSVFLLVRSPNDYFIYYILSVSTFVASALINIVYSRKFISFNFDFSKIKKYLKPFLIYGLYTLLTSAYTSLNITYLGFVSGEVEVGYYTTATKLFTIITSLFTALTGVILPRASALIAQGKQDEVKMILDKTIQVIFILGLPIIIIGVICANSIIYIIGGSGYEGAILPMQITMPLVIVIGIEQVLIIQGLMPLKKDKAVLRGTILGASISVVSNIVLTTYFASVGAAIVWFLSEMVVLLNANYFMNRYLDFHVPYITLIKKIITYVPIVIILLIINYLVVNVIVSFFVNAILLLIYFLLIEVLCYKNELILSLLKNKR